MGWCLLLASKPIRESSYSADEYAVALPCFGKVRTVFSCRLAFVPRRLAKSCERHDGPKIQIRSRIQSHLVRVRNLPLARYQCGLTGDALPCAVLIYPCVCESTVPLEGLTLFNAFVPIHSCNHRCISVQMNRHSIIVDLLLLHIVMERSFKEFFFIQQRAVVVDINQRFAQQLIQCDGVFTLFCMVPRALQRQQAAFLRIAFG